MMKRLKPSLILALSALFMCVIQFSSRLADTNEGQSHSAILECLQLDERLRRVEDTLKGKPTSALLQLKDYLDKELNPSGVSHALTLTPSGVELKIDHLRRDQKRFMLLAGRAIQEGSLTGIDAGRIFGPKVLIMLRHFISKTPKSGATLTIHGEIWSGIFNSARSEQIQGIVPKFTTGDATQWTQQEVQDFNAAVEELGLLSCRDEGRCNFKITISNGKAKIELSR